MSRVIVSISDEMKNVSAADRAYHAIRKSIINHQLVPGYPLLETELSEQLGMSRTPVREAIHRLKAEGLIETVRRKGIFVKALSKEEVKQSYEIAEGLEGMVAYLAANNTNLDKLEELRKNVEALENAIKENDTDLWVDADEHFHQTLYSLCENLKLVESLDRLNVQIQLSRLMITSGIMMTKIQSTRDHREMYEAIRKADAELARQITQKHWNRVRKEILGSIAHS